MTNEIFKVVKSWTFDMRLEDRGGSVVFLPFKMDIIEKPDLGFDTAGLDFSMVLDIEIVVDRQKDDAYSPSHCSQSGYYCFEQPNEIDTILNDKNTLEMIDASKVQYSWIGIFKEG